ncbi:MAG TPA: hypothetical protein VLA88_02785 [Candidatus Saccharimonadales bacterium]|nr:hypothetical protein [Candidatus Saccharimonadales bacterium]
MSIETIIALLTALIGLSGWAIFAYERFTAGPRLVGRALAIMMGRVSLQEGEFATYLAYLYITNLRNHSVHIFDYEMEADFGEGYIRLQRAYGIDTIPSYTFTDSVGRTIQIPDFQSKLIYKNSNPVGFGQNYRGFILFLGDVELYRKPVKSFRISCIDALGKRHRFNPTQQSGNLNLVQEMTGMVVPD